MRLSWTHPICDACWNKRNPRFRHRPARLRDIELEVCCFCGEKTRSGIYIREDPAELMCKGQHDRGVAV